MTSIPMPVTRIQGVADDLTQTAMLVRVVINRWDAVRTDKRVNREVAKAHGSDEDMGNYEKHLIHKGALEPLRKKADEIRAENYKRTLPWLDGGQRILSNAGFLPYVSTMRKLTAEFDDLKADFIAKYPQYVGEAKVKLNGLFDPTEYPTERELERKFAANYRVSPFPAAADFRVQMSDAERRVVQESIESDVRAAVNAAMAEVWGRLREVVSAMAERLTAYNVQGDKVTGVFRDSLVENVRDIVDLLPSLNVTQDPVLDQFTDRVREKLLAYDADTLRESLDARIDTAQAATQILAAMSDFV